MKKILIIVLTVISILVLLTACGEPEEVEESANQNIQKQSEQKIVSSWQESRIAFNKSFTGVTLKNNMLYGYGEESGIVVIAICDLLSGDIIQEIELLNATAVQSISVDGQGNIYVLGTTVEGYEFWKITGKGEIQLLGQIVLEDVDEAINVMPKGICVDAENQIYLWYEMGIPANIFYEDEPSDVYSMADRIYVKDNNLKTLFYEQVPNSKGTQLKNVYFDEKGKPILLIKDSEGFYLQGLYEENTTLRVDLGEEFMQMDFEVFSLNEEGFIFCSGSSLYQYSFYGQDFKKILDLLAYGIFPEDILYLVFGDETFEIVDNYRKGGYSEYTQLKMGEDEKSTLRLGTLQISGGLEQIVTEFNRYQDDIRIFEGELFSSVLEFAAEYTGYVGDDFLTDVQRDNILLSVGEIDSVAKFQLEKEIYGDDINFVGYPTTKGTGTAVGFYGSELAVNERSEKKDEAWRFVRYYLLNGYKGNGFPLCKEQFDEAMRKSMEKEYVIDGEGQYEIPKLTWGNGGNYIEIYAADPETVYAIKNLVAGIEYKFQYHTEIQAIINEEAESYFAGQKTIEEVAAVIQNRVSLYLQEQLN